MEENFQIQKEVSKQTANLSFRHLAIIFSNLAIFASAVSIAIALSGVITTLTLFVFGAILFCFLIIVSIVTLGIIYLVSDFGSLWGWFGKLADNRVIDIINYLYKILPFVSGISLTLSIVSIISLSLVKAEKSVGRIVANSILGFLSLIIFIFALAGVVGGAK